MRIRRKYIWFLMMVFFSLINKQGTSQTVKKIKMPELVEYLSTADHPLVVNVWATWCPPCLEELAWFDSLLQHNGNSSVELVLVSMDFANQYEKAIASFIEKTKLKATYYWLDETSADYFCPLFDKDWSGNIPVTLFVNNATGFRLFFDDQVKPDQFAVALNKLLTY
jgi:thiol-disulfide isomerase/thioredoxin